MEDYKSDDRTLDSGIFFWKILESLLAAPFTAAAAGCFWHIPICFLYKTLSLLFHSAIISEVSFVRQGFSSSGF